jgi:peptidoglycan hydrolase-like protein with peptidoglycan-binding domain
MSGASSYCLAMRSRRASLVVAIVVGLAACSSGGTKAQTTTTPLPTVPAATTAATSTTAAGSTTTASLAPGQTASSVAGGASTTAAARVVTNPSDSVHLGDTGSGVKQIQARLVAHGYKVATDGAFGPRTAAAVKDFQKKAGIAQDGVVGPVTWAKLQAAPTAATTTTVKK